MSKNHFLIDGHAGQLEATLDEANSPERRAIAVCCHPHPQHGGAMTNKVIYTVSKALAGMGIPSLRFNFRGVGKSEGSYDEGKGEQEDLRKAVEWMQQKYPGRPLWLAGFSFGSWIAALQAKSLSASQLISIAPPVNRFSFDAFEIPGCPWLLVQGDADEVVDPNAVYSWIEQLPVTPDLVRMTEAGHFFHSRLVELREILEQKLQPNLPELLQE